MLTQECCFLDRAALLRRYCQKKLTRDGEGGFVALPYDKTLPIQVDETWPGVSAPSCLSPWPGSQEPVHYWTIEHASSSCLRWAAARFALVSFARSAVRGPTAGVTVPNRYL